MKNRQFRNCSSRLSRPSLISVFSGAGGLDLGLESAGFELALAVEIDAHCQRTLGANFNCAFSRQSDVTKVNPVQILREAGLLPGELDLLAAGPPCQPFSKAAQWVTGRVSGVADARASTIDCFLDLAEAALPQVILVENVEGMVARSETGALNSMERRLVQINKSYGTSYSAQLIKLNAANYGVPQTRVRVFLLAQRDGLCLVPPAARFSDGGRDTFAITDSVQSLAPPVSSWNAIGDLQREAFGEDLKLRGKWADLVPSIPEGENYLWHTRKGGGLPLFGWRTRYWSFLLKLSKRRPSWTLAAQPGPSAGPLHWRNRYLATRELARLQTFPDTFKFRGPTTEIRKQIGNAVPPLLGEMLGLAIREQLMGHQVEDRLTLFKQHVLGPVPRRHPVRKVPSNFVSELLAKSVPDHPGVGLGPRAIKRAL